MAQDEPIPTFRDGARVGWEAALLEIEHQAEHWDTLEHGANGHLIAEALRTAARIARAGGLECEHQGRRQEIDPGEDENHTMPRAG